MRQTNEIGGIQYLRGIAAVVVVADHVSGMAAFPRYFGRDLLGGFLQTGMLGVSLFFVISGFIICIIALRGTGLEPAITLGRFAEKRAIRILPLMWVAIVSYAVLRYLGRSGQFHAAIYARTLILWPLGPMDPNPIWTLRHEAIFYTMFAASFLTRRSLRFLLPLWFVSPLLYASLGAGPNPTSAVHELLWRIANPVNLEFGTGFLLGWLYLRQQRALQLWAPFPTLILAMLGFMAIGYVQQISLQDIRSCLLSCSICGPIVYVGAHVACKPGTWDRIGRLLGNASFSIYLFHEHVGSALLGLWSRSLPRTPIGIAVIAIVCAATAVGMAIHLMIEKPLLAWSRGVADGWFRAPISHVKVEDW